MGEAADDAIDRGIDKWLFGEYDDDYYRSARLPVCRYCGVHGLHWGQSVGTWMLFEANNNAHVCSPKKRNAAAKEVFK